MKRIRIERSGHVGRITLSRPEKKNALDQIAARELVSAVQSLGADSDIRVILLAADGPDFCAGADLEALEAMLDSNEKEHLADAHALGAVFTEMRACPKPLVAAVRGRALAGGSGLATACDLVIADENSQFGYPEVRVGFVPAMVMTMLRRCVGEKRAFELVSTGRTIGAAEALELGIVSRVASSDAFDATVAELVDQLAGTPADALRVTKELFYSLDGRSFDEGVSLGARANAAARATADFRQGVQKFVRRGRENK